MTESAREQASAERLTERQLSKFARLLARQPTESEIVQLYRLKDVLGLEENDETWLFILALQHFEWLYEQHPAQIEEAVGQAAAQLKSAAEVVVKAEVGRVRGLLEQEVAAAAVAVADTRAGTSRRLALWWAGAGLALFGGFALVCGFELGRGGLPFWMHARVAAGGGVVAKVAGAILGAPAGWTALFLFLPVGVTWAKRGWARGHDWNTSSMDRARGWALISATVLGWALCAAALAWFVGGFWPVTSNRVPGDAQHKATESQPPAGAASPAGHLGRDTFLQREGYKSSRLRTVT